MRIVRRKIGGFLLPLAAPSLLRLLARSWKVERLDVQHFEQVLAKPGRMATLWHGHMLVPLPAHKHMDMRVLVSPSDDGSLVTMLLERFGYGVVRGSSNKNPARAVREMLTRLREGGWIIITPDGPRGPRHQMNPGPAWMARETGFPVLPCGFACDRSWHLKSWDAFTIPKFGARVAIAYGEPLYVDSEADDEEIRRATAELRERMFNAERKAAAHLGLEPEV